jgi:hypothetical protein
MSKAPRISARHLAAGAPGHGAPADGVAGGGGPGDAGGAGTSDGADGAAGGSPFSRRGAWIVAGTMAVSFLVTVLLSIFGDDLAPVPAAGSDGYSRSALGHRGLVEVLRAQGVPVVLSQHASADKSGEHGLLIVAEPQLGAEDAEALLGQLVTDAPRVLVVLPKRAGLPGEHKRTWLEETWLRPPARAAQVLDAAGLAGEVTRVASTTFTTNELGVAPTIGGPVQLLAGTTDLEPVVASEAGILVGVLHAGAEELWVLADPDVIENHGLGDGDNARFALALIARAAGDQGQVVVFDETLHGHVAAPSLLRELATFPLALASASVLLGLGVWIWAASGRFGPVVPPPPAIAPGKTFLVDNTAELMRQGGHSALALERYFTATLADVARRLHVPPGLAGAELRAHLAALARARRVSLEIAALEREVAEVSRAATPARALAAAGRIHRFRQEMIDGPPNHSRPS